MWSTDWAPLRLEAPSNEILSWLQLFQLCEMRHEEFLAGVGEGAEAAAGTTLRLVAETLAEEIWMVKELRSAVTECAGVALWAQALIIELLFTRLRIVGRCWTIGQHQATAVALAMEEGAAAVVVRGHRSLQAAWHCLELADHFFVLDLLGIVLGLHDGCPKKRAAAGHVWRQRAEKGNVSLICFPAQHVAARQQTDGTCHADVFRGVAKWALLLAALSSAVPSSMVASTCGGWWRYSERGSWFPWHDC
jgi:hypothetical protein